MARHRVREDLVERRRRHAPAPLRAQFQGGRVTGTEVITGTITDRNGPWISKELGGLGVEVSHILVVADRPDETVVLARGARHLQRREVHRRLLSKECCRPERHTR